MVSSAKALPVQLSQNAPLFNVPRDLARILDRDLAMAGIPKVDERGRTVDVHALRTTFATHLSKGGVAPRTAQAAMRHGSIDLTMNAYTDPRLLDVAGALDALPALPLDGKDEAEQLQETGTCATGPLAPTLAPTSDFWCKQESSPDTPGRSARAVRRVRTPAKRPRNGEQAARRMERAKGFEPSTFSLGS